MMAVSASFQGGRVFKDYNIYRVVYRRISYLQHSNMLRSYFLAPLFLDPISSN